MAKAASRELVAERAHEEIRVDGGHDQSGDARTPVAPWVHPHRRELGACGRGARRTLPGAHARHPGARRRVGRRSTPSGLARALRGLGTGALPSLWDRLGKLTVPVTLVVGERDQKFRQIAQLMAPAIAKSEVMVVPGAGHAVHLEAFDKVAEIISSRFASSPAG